MKESMDWDSISDVFERDGSLRDIYVFDTNVDDWQKLLAWLKAGPYALRFSIGNSPSAVPDSVNEIFAVSNDPGVLLTVDPDGLHLNCHFFVLSEIEFDLWPKDIAGQEVLSRLLDFMRAVGELLGRPVVLTPEGMENIPLIRFDPASGNVNNVRPGGAS
jgi:hypothetical protein